MKAHTFTQSFGTRNQLLLHTPKTLTTFASKAREAKSEKTPNSSSSELWAPVSTPKRRLWDGLVNRRQVGGGCTQPVDQKKALMETQAKAQGSQQSERRPVKGCKGLHLLGSNAGSVTSREKQWEES